MNGQLGDGSFLDHDVPTLIAPAGGAGNQPLWSTVPPDRLLPTRIGTGTGWTDVTAGRGVANEYRESLSEADPGLRRQRDSRPSRAAAARMPTTAAPPRTAKSTQ